MSGNYRVTLTILNCNGTITKITKIVNVYQPMREGITNGITMVAHETETNNIKLWGLSFGDTYNYSNGTFKLVGVNGSNLVYDLLETHWRHRAIDDTGFGAFNAILRNLGVVEIIGEDLKVIAFPYHNGQRYIKINFMLKYIETIDDIRRYHLDVTNITPYSNGFY